MAGAKIKDGPKGRIGNLLTVWRYALRYKWTLAAAGTALLIAAGATLAIPDGFRRLIDRGFQQRRPDRPSVQLSARHGGAARAGDRDPLLLRLDARREGRRRHPHRAARQHAAPRAALLRGEPALGDRLADHRRHRGDRDGGRRHRLAGAEEPGDGRRRHRLSVHAGAADDAGAGDRHSVDRGAGRAARPAGAQHLALQPGPDRRSRHDRRRDAGRDEDRPGVRPGEAREQPLPRGGRGTPSPPPGGGSCCAPA